MQKDGTDDLLHQELSSLNWDIIKKDILSIKSEFEKLIV